MGSILAKYEKDARSANVYGKQTNAARKWFYDVVSKLPINRRRLLGDSRVQQRTRFLPGRMYAFIYDPKGKGTLPYYDRFPLVILLEQAKTPNGKPNGFYGLNLHYLPPKTRAEFLDTLMGYVSNNKMDERTRFRLSYSFIHRAAKFKSFRPCFKHYLPEYVKSQMVEIKAPDWITACYLPIDHFTKKDRNFVWSESMRILNG